MLALVALPLALLSGWNVWRQWDSREEQLRSERVSVARAVAQAADGIIASDLSVIQTLGELPAFRDPDLGLVQEAIEGARRANAGLEFITLYDAAGWNITGSLLPPRSLNIADRRYFQSAAAGTPALSDLIIGRGRNLPAVTLTAPVSFVDGSRGVVAATLSLDALAQQLRPLVGREHVELVVVDSQGVIVLHPDPELGRQLTSWRDRPEVSAVLSGEANSLRVKPGEEEELVAFAPVGERGWGVLIRQPATAALAPAREDVLASSAILGLAFLFIGGLGWVASGREVAIYRRMVAARRAAEQAQERFAFLAEASRALASSLDEETTLKSLADIAVPQFADWCVVDLVDTPGSWPARRLAVAHQDPAKVQMVRELGERYPPNPKARYGVPQVLRTGRPEWSANIPDELLVEVAVDESHLRLLRELALRSYIVVPLEVRGRILGAMTFVTAESGRRYSEEDVQFAQELARRAALAVENAQLYREAQQRAETESELNTALRETAQQREQALHQLRQAMATRDEFVASIAHDLKNPLTTAKGIAQLLLRAMNKGAQPDPVRVQAGLVNIEDAIGQIDGSIEELLDLTRMQAGKPLDLDLKLVDAISLVERIAAEHRGSTERHQVEVRALEKELTGRWDEVRLARAVSNLIGNAIKFSPAGGVVRITVLRDATDSEWVVVEVADQGIGIPEADQEHVFARFHRASNVVGKIPGTGIGLASVRQIVEQHGGTISVESKEGSGSTFKVRLPLDIQIVKNGSPISTGASSS